MFSVATSVSLSSTNSFLTLGGLLFGRGGCVFLGVKVGKDFGSKEIFLGEGKGGTGPR